MQQQENSGIKREIFINIRKLTALDIVFHGSIFILAECAVGVFVSGALGAISLFAYLHNAAHPISFVTLAFVFTWISINYMPMLLYAIVIVRTGSAEREVSFELEHKDYYARKYTVQSLLLVLPLIVPILAISQEIQKRLH